MRPPARRILHWLLDHAELPPRTHPGAVEALLEKGLLEPDGGELPRVRLTAAGRSAIETELAPRAPLPRTEEGRRWPSKAKG